MWGSASPVGNLGALESYFWARRHGSGTGEGLSGDLMGQLKYSKPQERRSKQDADSTGSTPTEGAKFTR